MENKEIKTDQEYVVAGSEDFDSGKILERDPAKMDLSNVENYLNSLEGLRPEDEEILLSDEFRVVADRYYHIPGQPPIENIQGGYWKEYPKLIARIREEIAKGNMELGDEETVKTYEVEFEEAKKWAPILKRFDNEVVKQEVPDLIKFAWKYPDCLRLKDDESTFFQSPEEIFFESQDGLERQKKLEEKIEKGDPMAVWSCLAHLEHYMGMAYTTIDRLSSFKVKFKDFSRAVKYVADAMGHDPEEVTTWGISKVWREALYPARKLSRVLDILASRIYKENGDSWYGATHGRHRSSHGGNGWGFRDDERKDYYSEKHISERIGKAKQI